MTSAPIASNVTVAFSSGMEGLKAVEHAFPLKTQLTLIIFGGRQRGESKKRESSCQVLVLAFSMFY